MGAALRSVTSLTLMENSIGSPLFGSDEFKLLLLLFTELAKMYSRNRHLSLLLLFRSEKSRKTFRGTAAAPDCAPVWLHLEVICPPPSTYLTGRNQPSTQSVRQSIGQSIQVNYTQSTRTIDIQRNETGQFNWQSVSRSYSRSVGQAVGRSVEQSVGQSDGQSVENFMSWKDAG